MLLQECWQGGRLPGQWHNCWHGQPASPSQFTRQLLIRVNGEWDASCSYDTIGTPQPFRRSVLTFPHQNYVEKLSLNVSVLAGNLSRMCCDARADTQWYDSYYTQAPSTEHTVAARLIQKLRRDGWDASRMIIGMFVFGRRANEVVICGLFRDRRQNLLKVQVKTTKE
jgi:hypothetical protein